MIKLTAPEHGWITLRIASGKREIIIDFSDVGPDSIAQLQTAVEKLRTNENKCEVLFYLEPEYTTLSIVGSKNASVLSISTDGNHAQTLDCDRAAFVKELDLELGRIMPLCVDPNWTNPGQAENENLGAENT